MDRICITEVDTRAGVKMSNSAQPIVSICVPTHNRRKLLGLTLESILKQDFERFEVLVGDDASTDGTENTVRQFSDSRIKYIRNERNLGQVGTQNKLVKLAQGKYVIFTHDDNVLLPTMIRKCVDVLERNLDAVFSVPLSRLIDVNGNVIHEPNRVGDKDNYVIDGEKMVFQFLPDFTPEIDTLHSKKIETSFPSAVFRKDKIIEAGMFDEEVLVACDLLLQSKLCLVGKVALINEVLFDYRLHDNWGSKLSANATYADEFELLTKKLFTFMKSQTGITVPANFELNVQNRLGKYLFSFNGGIPRIAAKYNGKYSDKVNLILRTAQTAYKHNPSLRYNPKSWIILLLSLLIPKSLLQRIEGVYLKMILRT